MRILCTIASVALWAAIGPLGSQVYGDTEPACSSEEEQLAKGHFDRAEALKKEQQFRDAIAEYGRAYGYCQRSVLVFNTAQTYWLSGDRQSALDWYETYLRLEHSGPACDLARERLFMAAEELYSRGQLEAALSVYRRYLELAPDGARQEAVKGRVAAISRANESSSHPAGGAPDNGSISALQSDTVTGEPAKVHRIGIYVSVSVAVAGLAAAGVSGWQLSRFVDDKSRAVRHFQNSTGTQLSPTAVCDDVEARGPEQPGLQPILDACRSGRRRALLVNVFAGVALAGASTAGYLLYRQYRARESATEATSGLVLAPVVTAESMGASAMIRF